MKKYLLVLLLFVIFLTGCSSNSFVGVWYFYRDDVLLSVEFHEDMTCETYVDAKMDEGTCTYSYDDRVLTVKREGENDISIIYEFGDDYLLFKNVNVYLYKSIKEARENKSGSDTVKLSEKVTIPDVSGFSVIEAENVLERAGFVVSDKTLKEASDEFDYGTVIKTSPEAGLKVGKGSTITLIVSSGSKIE